MARVILSCITSGEKGKGYSSCAIMLLLESINGWL